MCSRNSFSEGSLAQLASSHGWIDERGREGGKERGRSPLARLPLAAVAAASDTLHPGPPPPANRQQMHTSNKPHTIITCVIPTTIVFNDIHDKPKRS